MKEQRAQPQLTRLSGENQQTAALVSGWIRHEELPRLVERVAQTLGEALSVDEPARIAAAVAALAEDDENGLEWRFAFRPPMLAHFLPERGHIAVDVLLEGQHEPRVEAVRKAFAASTVDPRAA